MKVDLQSLAREGVDHYPISVQVVQFPCRTAPCQSRDIIDHCSKVSALLSIHRRLQNNIQTLIAFFERSESRPFAALITTLVAPGCLTAPHSRIRQRTTALGKTADPYGA
jgi:hypothetical protein